jgi:alpha-beta hydrolase superfamily lysophospholipase
MNEVSPTSEPAVLDTPDGHVIRLRGWAPDGPPRGVIQLIHGMGEHGGRYGRFARAAAARGYHVAVHDHRGHGPEAACPGHVADAGGWQLLVDDAGLVNAALRERHAGRPLVVLGHSMGSFVAQHLAMRTPSGMDGLLLSASTWPQRLELGPALAITRLEMLRLGPRGHSTLLHRLGFGKFNRHFSPARTEFDWLSRDENEVDRYIADPLCGGPFSCAFWRDLLVGLWALGSDGSLERIPADLPLLIAGGADDPVGGDRGLRRLAMHYAQTGHGRLRLRIYDDGRHEMLNEIDREAVTAEWLDWIDATTRSGHAG